MDGRNSSGRRISLLNDSEDRPANVRLRSLPSISVIPHLSLRTRAFSYASTLSPPRTPRLVRSESTDSTPMQTPSPITPDFNFEALPPNQHMSSPVFSQQVFFQPQQKHPATVYLPSEETGLLPYSAEVGANEIAYFQGQSVDPQPSNPRSKKNSYPCPLAKQFGCNDYFTTSGHAARHAKKHTGKKDAFCPECNKAFTRKDNMEQHRRTHQNGRSASKAITGDASKKPKQQSAKRPRPAPLQSDAMNRSHSSMSVMPLSPDSSYETVAPAVQPVEGYTHKYSHRSPYPDMSQYSTPSAYQAGGTLYGLDALAIAATREKRKVGP